MNVLTVENISAAFGPRTDRGLHEVSFSLDDGKMAFLMGRNGAGKTSLLEVVAGHRKARGRVLIAGQDVSAWPPHRRSQFMTLLRLDIGIGLPGRMTVFEALALWGEAGSGRFTHPGHRFSMIQARELIGEHLPHLTNKLADQISTLSGGERQLLSLACVEAALLGTKRSSFTLLLDEHTANLDPWLSEQVMNASRRLVVEYGLACLAVTHSAQLAAAFGDRVLIVDDGRLCHDSVQDGNGRMTETEIRSAFGRETRP